MTNVVKYFTIKLTIHSGDTIGVDEVKIKIEEKQKKKVERSGLVQITKVDIKPHPTTLTKYQALVTHQADVSICKKVVKKTSGRYTAESSLISAMALLCVIAVNNYRPYIEYNQNIYHEMQFESKRVQLLYNKMQTYYDASP